MLQPAPRERIMHGHELLKPWVCLRMVHLHRVLAAECAVVLWGYLS